ncbi:MAG: hypothetical protein ACJ0BN_00210 [Limisphaerales bacterium]
MNVRTRARQQLQPRHYFALIGLSEPILPDDVTGDKVPFKLSKAERQYMFEETDIALDQDSAIDGAQTFFKKNYPHGNIYYKNSRFYRAGVLHSLKYQEALEGFGCT